MGTRLFVGNIPYSATEDSLKELFSRNERTVVDVKIITDRVTGRSRGFGFVELSSDTEAENAMTELNGFEMDGRRLTVNEARERQGSRGGGPGRY